jgi:hypothetical protein
VRAGRGPGPEDKGEDAEKGMGIYKVRVRRKMGNVRTAT